MNNQPEEMNAEKARRIVAKGPQISLTNETLSIEQMVNRCVMGAAEYAGSKGYLAALEGAEVRELVEAAVGLAKTFGRIHNPQEEHVGRPKDIPCEGCGTLKHFTDTLAKFHTLTKEGRP